MEMSIGLTGQDKQEFLSIATKRESFLVNKKNVAIDSCCLIVELLWNIPFLQSKLVQYRQKQTMHRFYLSSAFCTSLN